MANFIAIPFLAESTLEIVAGKPKVRVPINEASLTIAIKEGGTGSPTVFGAKDGSTTVVAPKSNEFGEFPYWLEEGSYTLTISKSGFPSKNVEFEAVSEKQSSIPVGTILYYAGSTAPFGFLLGNGEKHLKASYKALWEEIKEIYGTASSTEFYVPDIRGRFVASIDAGAGRITGATLASSGGSSKVTLTAAQSGLPEHKHGLGGYSTLGKLGAVGGGGGTFVVGGEAGATETSVINGGAKAAAESHENLPPYIVLNAIIKY